MAARSASCSATARGRWLTASPFERRFAAFVLALSAGVASVPARADVSLAPSSDGHLGAWLTAGPVTRERVEQIDLAALTPAKGAHVGGLPAFRLISARDGALDLDKALGTDKKAGASALLAGELELGEDLDGWLLLSVDGGVRVVADGKTLFERQTARLRASSWDAIPLALARGRHRLVLVLQHPGQWWAVETRLLARGDLLPPRGASLVLPGTDDADASALSRELLTATLDAGLARDGFHPVLALEYRRGAPRAPALPVSVGLGGLSGGPKALRVGTLPVGERGVAPFRVELPAVESAEPGASAKLSVDAHVGPARVQLSAALSSEWPKWVDRALALSERADKLGVSDPETVRATLEWRISELGRSASAKSALEELVTALEAGKDPLRSHGLVALARRSPVDDEPDPLLLHVPASYQPGSTTRYPLVVALHGLNGNPERIMQAFLDSKSTAPSVDGFVLAPYAHGNAFYRGPGEREVMAAVDWALARYPIDPARVAITGVSMGGTGSAHLGLWYADRFSAAAPLCGYQSYFVRRDTAKRPIRPWENERMHHWSPTSWAERGRNLPMWVAHGTKDFPLENSKVLVKRYKELGFSMTDEWPDTGHDVWTKAYAGARLWPWLSQKKRDPAPAHVSLKTDQLRFGHEYWVRVTELETPGHMGLVDAEVKSDRRVAVHAEGVNAFELDRPEGHVAADAAVDVDVDGKVTSFAAKEPLTLVRGKAGWEKGKPPPAGKRAGLEGPIRDAYLEPLVFVYGTLDPRTARANREVAEHFAHGRHGPDVAYRVLADRDFDAATEASHAVFAVGTPSDNRLLAAVGASLPIHVDGGALYLGATRLDKPGTGAIFVQPNPRHPERYLVVVTGVDAAGIWRALSLPQLLPDFLVYDDALAPAAGEILLGRDAKVIAGGFFDRDWKLPANTADQP